MSAKIEEQKTEIRDMSEFREKYMQDLFEYEKNNVWKPSDEIKA
jgi:hypothetical protein